MFQKSMITPKALHHVTLFSLRKSVVAVVMSLAVSHPFLVSADRMSFEQSAQLAFVNCQEFVGKLNLAESKQAKEALFRSHFEGLVSATGSLGEVVAENPELATTDAGDKVLSCITELAYSKKQLGL